MGYLRIFYPFRGVETCGGFRAFREASLRVVESAYNAYDSWRKLPIPNRVSYLFKLRKAMEVHSEELAVSIAIEQAKKHQ